MAAIVYVETNFLMSVAMGREAQGETLLKAAVRVAMPSSCIMESLAALKGEQNRRNVFRRELDAQITQLRRDTTSQNAGLLLQRLEESRTANDQLLNDVQDRLFQFIELASRSVEFIAEPPAVYRSAVSGLPIADPTDNLTLHAILDDAARFPAAQKALLTDNTRDFALPEVQNALATAGIHKQFRSVANLLGWLGAQAGS